MGVTLVVIGMVLLGTVIVLLLLRAARGPLKMQSPVTAVSIGAFCVLALLLLLGVYTQV